MVHDEKSVDLYLPATRLFTAINFRPKPAHAIAIVIGNEPPLPDGLQ
jgi:hypothetical protein